MEQRNQVMPKRLLKEAFPPGMGRFRPHAFFDNRLDCIRVVTQDCSVLEDRISDRLTVLLDNRHERPGPDQCVGFTVKGARHFCQEHGWNESINVIELLDAILATSPPFLIAVFVNTVAKPLVKKQKIEQVEMPGDSFEPIHATG